MCSQCTGLYVFCAAAVCNVRMHLTPWYRLSITCTSSLSPPGPCLKLMILEDCLYSDFMGCLPLIDKDKFNLLLLNSTTKQYKEADKCDQHYRKWQLNIIATSIPVRLTTCFFQRKAWTHLCACVTESMLLYLGHLIFTSIQSQPSNMAFIISIHRSCNFFNLYLSWLFCSTL